MGLYDRILGLLGRAPQQEMSPERRPSRGAVTHVVILDGTMSSLEPGCETNAGLLYKLLAGEVDANLSLYYEAGLQWRDWKTGLDVLIGRGLNRQIRRAYGVLAGRYRPGDEIVLVGYSRGAYAVRSLGGVIERVGLLKPEYATVRHIRQAYRLYEGRAEPTTIADFANTRCHSEVEIEAIAVWDTVKALGVRLPVLWMLAERKHSFHNHRLGTHVRNGFQALALDETRVAYRPILWESQANWSGTLRQVWFRGTHGDIGGQLKGFEPARPLANIPFVWLVSQLEACGVPLPADWTARFPQDPDAPSVSNWRGMGKFFFARRTRRAGFDPSEEVHHSAVGRTKRADKALARQQSPDPMVLQERNGSAETMGSGAVTETRS